jgi:hypothetical protein
MTALRVPGQSEFHWLVGEYLNRVSHVRRFGKAVLSAEYWLRYCCLTPCLQQDSRKAHCYLLAGWYACDRCGNPPCERKGIA